MANLIMNSVDKNWFYHANNAFGSEVEMFPKIDPSSALRVNWNHENWMIIQSGAYLFMDKWTSNQCTNKVYDTDLLSSSPPPASNADTHRVVCGREGWSVKNIAMDRDNELHEIRCCLYIEIAWWRTIYGCGRWR